MDYGCRDCIPHLNSSSNASKMSCASVAFAFSSIFGRRLSAGSLVMVLGALWAPSGNNAHEWLVQALSLPQNHKQKNCLNET